MADPEREAAEQSLDESKRKLTLAVTFDRLTAANMELIQAVDRAAAVFTRTIQLVRYLLAAQVLVILMISVIAYVTYENHQAVKQLTIQTSMR